MMKKVLILSCNTGQGHNSCAQAIEDYCKTKNVHCEKQDALSFCSIRFSKVISWGHSFIYRHLPGLFRWGYGYSERHPAVFRDTSYIYKLLTAGSERIHSYIAQEQFDTVICTHVFTAMILTDMLRKHPMEIKTAFVATDYTCSPSMDASNLQHYFIPHESLIGEFTRYGIPPERITVTGIPVQAGFMKYIEKDDAKRLLGIHAHSRHLLIMCGSMGCGPISQILAYLAAYSANDIEVSVICGNNRHLQKKLSGKYRNHKEIHIIGYTHQIPLYIASADLYLTKPGGISVTEAAFENTPMMFVNAVAGCETYNMKFFMDANAATTASSPKKIASQSILLLRNDAARNEMVAALMNMEKTNGAEQIIQKLSEDMLYENTSQKRVG